jgi:hypothetical protein
MKYAGQNREKHSTHYDEGVGEGWQKNLFHRHKMQWFCYVVINDTSDQRTTI